MQQGLAETHEGHAARLAGGRLHETVHDRLERGPLHEPLGSSQAWRTHVLQSRLQAFVGST